MTAPVKLIYVLGAAYSGTTLFSLALGQHARILNLGEVSMLAHDYRPDTVCSCGEPLSSCNFWSRVSLASLSNKRQSALKLDETSQLDHLDRRDRSWRETLWMTIGRSAESIYGREKLNSYARRHTKFFQLIKRECPDTEFLVDCSKSPERLEALMMEQDLEIFCIHLVRHPWSLAASRFKRLHASHRISAVGGKVIALFKQKVKQARIHNLRSRLSGLQWIEVSFERFTSDPRAVVNELFDALGLQQPTVENGDKYLIDASRQHIYVGNRWLFRSPDPMIAVRKNAPLEGLSRQDRALLKMFFGGPPRPGWKSQ